MRPLSARVGLTLAALLALAGGTALWACAPFLSNWLLGEDGKVMEGPSARFSTEIERLVPEGDNLRAAAALGLGRVHARPDGGRGAPPEGGGPPVRRHPGARPGGLPRPAGPGRREPRLGGEGGARPRPVRPRRRALPRTAGDRRPRHRA